MIDFFYYLYNSTFKFYSFFKVARLDKLIRFFTYVTLNIYVRIFFEKLKRSNHFGVCNSSDFYVSLTSFPARVGNLHLVILSILLQKNKPRAIKLFLSKEQFEGEKVLPSKLLSLKPYGLEIIFVDEDYRSYKKFCYLKDLSSVSGFVTVDDDIIYPSYLLTYLLDFASKYPNSVIANRCLRINISQKYNTWPLVSGEPLKSFNIFPTGCGGVFYPSGSLHSIAYNPVFMDVAPDADDIWLNCATFLNSRDVVYTGFQPYFIGAYSSNNINLHSKNISHNNDAVLSSVSSFFTSKYSFDIFNR